MAKKVVATLKTGKGNNLSLTKDGKVIFEHQDDVPTTDGTNNEANNDITKLTQKEDMSAKKNYQVEVRMLSRIDDLLREVFA